MIDQHKSLSEKFIKKGFWLYLFSFIIAPIGYIIKIIISDSLSVSDVWLLYWVLSFVWLISIYNDLWLTESLSYFLPKFITEKKYDKVKTILFYTLSIQMISWIIIALLLYFWSNYLALHYFKNENASIILKYFTIYFIWLNIFQILQSFFSSIQNTLYKKWLDFIRMSSIIWFTLYFYFSDLKTLENFSLTWIYWLYIWIIFSIILFYKQYYRKYLQNEKIFFSKTFFIKILSYAIFVFIWAQASSILWQMDMQMIIYLLWTKWAWYYTNYLSIIGIPFMLIWPIFGLLFPVFSELASKKQFNKIKLTKEIFFKIFIWVWIALNILMFVLSDKIAYSLFWEKFLLSWVILQYSILFLIFNYLLQINFNILAWIWKIKIRVKILSIALIFNFFANLFLIKHIWVQWAALATWLWWVLIFILSEYFLWKQFRVKIDIIYTLKNILFMWSLWLIILNYKEQIFWMFWNIFRLWSFWILFVIWILYFIIFALINLKEFKILTLEIKKIKQWK